MESDEYIKLQDALMARAKSVVDKVRLGEMSNEAGDAESVLIAKHLQQARLAFASASKKKARRKLLLICGTVALVVVAVIIIRWVA
ncbi:hypothetical protein [Microcoleus sp. M2_C2]|uniref:hypothetical protein n=1 Tax=unclassified Microcoleus TaxID=2642155 RepID=UPI002FD6CE6B